MKTKQKVRRLLYSIRRTVGVRSPTQAFAYLMERAARSAGRGQFASEPSIPEHPFDTRYGTRTSGLIESNPADTARHAYYGVSPSVFRTMCHLWQESLEPRARIEDYTFIDLGAGMGRAILLASEFPFRKVIGVEVNCDLIPIARQNIGSWVATQSPLCPIEITEEDVMNFTPPSGPLLIFLYNPFGEEILEKVLQRLLKCEYTVDVLYIYPVFGWMFERGGAFRELWMKLIALEPSDAEVDAFRSTSETCAAYRKGSFTAAS